MFLAHVIPLIWDHPYDHHRQSRKIFGDDAKITWRFAKGFQAAFTLPSRFLQVTVVL